MRLREGTCVSKDMLKRNQDSLLRDFPFNLPEGLNRQAIIIQQIYTELVLFGRVGGALYGLSRNSLERRHINEVSRDPSCAHWGPDESREGVLSPEE